MVGLNKILILGSKGNLGQQLVAVLKNDYEVIAFDRDEVDITDRDLVIKKINDIKPDIIINAAAYNAVDKCEEEEGYEIAKKINGEAPEYLAQGALEANAVLVHYSSDYVFNGEKKEGYKEDDSPNPISKYGETKLMGERAIMNLSEQGLKYYLIRTSKLFGSIGKSEQSKQSFFDTILKLAKEKKEIDVVDEEVSSFTYTPDLAKATKELVESAKEYGIFHIVNSGPCTWYEAVKELFKLAGVNVRVNPVTSDKFPRPAKRPKYSVLLNTKLKPMRDWNIALKEYLNNK
jgi:dTDP-4-dehydrorhamnose reductase